MYINSRYADGHVTQAVTKGGDAVFVVTRTWPSSVPNYLVYRWMAGDRIDRVASALNIPRTKWSVIMDANPSLAVPTAIQPGTVIRIPRTL
jgi:hypothetical protein